MKRIIAFLLALVLTLSTAVFAMASGTSGFSGGAGTAEDPYQIASAADLAKMAKSVANGSAKGYAGTYFKLTKNLDLSGVELEPIGNMSDMKTFGSFFQGTFDGANHRIRHLNMEAKDAIMGYGLFGAAFGATFKNLTIEDSQISNTKGQLTGAMLGFAANTVIDHCVTRNVKATGNNCTGTLIGTTTMGGAVTNCTVLGGEVNVVGDNDFQGKRIIQHDIGECGGLLVGGGFNAHFENDYAQGVINALGKEPVGLGGLGGCMVMIDEVKNCSADVVVNAPYAGHAIGGLAGYAGTLSPAKAQKIMSAEGIANEKYPAVFDNIDVRMVINAKGGTHVGGIIGTGLYYYGEETRFIVQNSKVNGAINGAVTPGTVVGRGTGSSIKNVRGNVLIDGKPASNGFGQTTQMYESADQ